MSIRIVDELEDGFGWIESATMGRTSHALAVDGRVWLTDPIDADGVEERIRSLGEPAGVIQLLDRHKRDGAALASRLGVPLHVVPTSLPGTPFLFLPVVQGRWWKEVALWWPERRVLVCADALGTAPYYRSGAERLAVHPLLRVRPPRRQLGALQPDVILCGHGEGVLEDAGTALREALTTSLRRVPGQVASALRAWRASRPS